MDNNNDLYESFARIFDVDGEMDKTILDLNISLKIGVVVDTDDPLQEGRLRIFCPSLNDSPQKLHHLPWASYVSPFGGAINNSCFTRGSNPDNATSSGAIHYGFHGVPEQGAHALVGCIDGDTRRRFWLGCFPSHQETHTLFNGRFKWNSTDGQPDGPLTSSDDKIQPIYDNLSEAFNNDRKSREWKTRGADFQAMAVRDDVGQIPNANSETYLDEQQQSIANAEEDAWVKDILGAHGYDWTAFKNLGSFLASKVYGITTPGFHTLSMDDRPFNCRIRLRSTAGSQLLIDDTNERIYLSTAKGKNWIEMDQNGNIDVYGKRLSFHAEEDINMSAEGSFRVKAKTGIYMYAGDTTGQSPLSSLPADGQIRLHSSNDTHIYTEGNLRQHVLGNNYIEVNGDIDVISANWKQQADSSYSLSSNTVIVSADSNITQVVSSSGMEISSSSVTVASISTTISDGVVSFTPTMLQAEFSAKLDGGGGTISGSPLTVSGSPDSPTASDAEISPWTNRVPQHEPWPRVMMTDTQAHVNQLIDGYHINTDWIIQFDNSTSPDGLQPIGRYEGSSEIDRGRFWRR